MRGFFIYSIVFFIFYFLPSACTEKQETLQQRFNEAINKHHGEVESKKKNICLVFGCLVAEINQRFRETLEAVVGSVSLVGCQSENLVETSLKSSSGSGDLMNM